MQALLRTVHRLLLRVLFKPLCGPPVPLALRRRFLKLISGAAGSADGVERTELHAGEVPMTRLRAGPGELVGPAPAAERDAVLYVHGGGFVAGGDGTYDGFASRIAAATAADVYVPDYRLAPEHPFPAPGDDLFAAYRQLLELGHDASRIAIVGDSAGGALATSLALTIPEMGEASPAAVVLISPWLDLSLSGASIAANAKADPMLRRALLEEGGRAHAGELRRADPRVSPLFADLRALPPTLVQVGSDEILLDDSTRFADRAFAAGVEVELQRFEGMWHDFQTTAGTLETAAGAVDDIAGFIARRIAAADSSRRS